MLYLTEDEFSLRATVVGILICRMRQARARRNESRCFSESHECLGSTTSMVRTTN